MPVHAAEILDVRLWRAPDHTRVVFDLSESISYTTLELDNPRRLVIDMADARLINALTNLPLNNTPIARVRSGVRKGNDLRIVFLSLALRT
jgi:N-acetylmuramoyl-L-alanine amidase